MRFFLYGIVFLSGLAFSGCYQIHSGDDLRAVPVTNNPRLVPGDGGWNGPQHIAMP